MRSVNNNIIVIIIFSIAMAALESAVVVYLRALYYPDGFTVAFKLIDENILIVEIIREVATLLMIASVAFLTGKSRYERFAYFLMCFAIWDIFYYVWLKIFINWPLSFFEWDILFLIPVTWLGPVLSPIICSITMILLSAVILRNEKEVRIDRLSWCMLTGGSLIIIYTYLIDYGTLLFVNDFIVDYEHIIRNKKFISIASAYLPNNYNWNVFWIGELIIIVGALRIYQNGKVEVLKILAS